MVANLIQYNFQFYMTTATRVAFLFRKVSDPSGIPYSHKEYRTKHAIVQHSELVQNSDQGRNLFSALRPKSQSFFACLM